VTSSIQLHKQKFANKKKGADTVSKKDWKTEQVRTIRNVTVSVADPDPG
jgi:hypothetical protein